MITVEVYTHEDGLRYVDQAEYKDYLEWEKDWYILKFRDVWVGHKVYEMPIKEFNKLSQTQKNNINCKAVFDKESYLNKHQEKTNEYKQKQNL